MNFPHVTGAILFLLFSSLVPAHCGETKAAPKDAQSILVGCELYTTHCAACHGSVGKGNGHAGYVMPKRPPNLTELSDDSDEDLLEVITYGKRSMPQYKKMLTEKQRLEVIAYMRTFIVKVIPATPPPKPSGVTAPPASPAEAASLKNR